MEHPPPEQKQRAGCWLPLPKCQQLQMGNQGHDSSLVPNKAHITSHGPAGSRLGVQVKAPARGIPSCRKSRPCPRSCHPSPPAAGLLSPAGDRPLLPVPCALPQTALAAPFHRVNKNPMLGRMYECEFPGNRQQCCCREIRTHSESTVSGARILRKILPKRGTASHLQNSSEQMAAVALLLYITSTLFKYISISKSFFPI